MISDSCRQLRRTFQSSDSHHCCPCQVSNCHRCYHHRYPKCRGRSSRSRWFCLSAVATCRRPAPVSMYLPTDSQTVQDSTSGQADSWVQDEYIWRNLSTAKPTFHSPSAKTMLRELIQFTIHSSQFTVVLARCTPLTEEESTVNYQLPTVNYPRASTS